MAVQLNHTIVLAHDKRASAEFLARMLGIQVSPQFGPFLPVKTANGVALDYLETRAEHIESQHYAFLVTEAEFDEIFGRIRQENVAYYAHPLRRGPGEINHNDGGRGVYFEDPDGHMMEIITVPYGGSTAG